MSASAVGTAVKVGLLETGGVQGQAGTGHPEKGQDQPPPLVAVGREHPEGHTGILDEDEIEKSRHDLDGAAVGEASLHEPLAPLIQDHHREADEQIPDLAILERSHRSSLFSATATAAA